MTIARCYGLALKIAEHDRRKWPSLLEEVTTQCKHTDCTANNCREVCKAWLRMQWRIQVTNETNRTR